MKTFWNVFGGVTCLLVVGLYLLFTPTHGRSLGVSVTPRVWQTGAPGLKLYAISNHTSHPVLILPGIERKDSPSRLIDLSLTQRVLAAHSELVIAISNVPPERALVHCQRELFWGFNVATAKRLAETYFTFRRESEIIYP